MNQAAQAPCTTGGCLSGSVQYLINAPLVDISTKHCLMKPAKQFEPRTLLPAAALLLLLAVLTACSSATPITPSPASPSSTALPASPEHGTQLGNPLDTSCSKNADCAVKDVGNCCGTMPACVNKDSPTDPQAVQARCAASGQMGICGFRQISACQCDNGQCVEAPAANGLRNAPIPNG